MSDPSISTPNESKPKSDAPPSSVDNAEIPIVDMEKVYPRQVSTGLSRGIQQLGTPNVFVDSGDNQIIVAKNDVNQVLMGDQVNFGEGFYVTKEGVDAKTAKSAKDFIFNSNQNVFKIVKTDTILVDFIDAPVSVLSVAHNLGFAPIPMAFLIGVTDGAASGNFPFPVTLGLDTTSVPGTILNTSYVRVASDTVNVYFEIFNATGSELGVFNVRYYLLQETSG